MSLVFRLLRALWVFGRIAFSYLLQLGLERVAGKTRAQGGWLARRRAKIDLRNARRLRRSMLRLRGVYIKMGQVLSIMGGFLPRVYGAELESLQDKVPPHSFATLRKVFRREFGRDATELFERIEETPVAAASLGQVHVAYLLGSGEKVAVKVLYPGIRDVIRVDMRVVRLALTVYRWFVPVQNIERVHDALVNLLRRETDYLHEAECMERMARNFAEDDDIVFPRVIRDLTTRDVLTMTYVDGIKVTRFAELEENGVDRRAVGTRLVQCFYRQLFVDRFFHADPHPGNILVQPTDDPERPRIVWLDFGAVSEVSQEVIDGMVDILQGFFEQNDALVMRGIERIGFVAPSGNRSLIERTVKTYFAKLLKIKDRTAGALMRARRSELEELADPEVEGRELRQLMRSVQYPEGWFYVERASVLMFWLAGQIDPELDTFQVGIPYALTLLADRTQAASSA